MGHGEGPEPAKDGRDKVGGRLYWRGGPGIVGGWIAFEMPAGIGWLSFPRSGPRPEGQYRVFSFLRHTLSGSRVQRPLSTARDLHEVSATNQSGT